MTETTKTISLAALAAVLLVTAIIARPKPPYVAPEGVVGEPLFPEWKDASAVKSMEISTYDVTSPQPATNFKVELVNGGWSIPSHGNYPANTDDKHVTNAAVKLLKLKVIEVPSRSPASHELYGVVEPDPTKFKGPPPSGLGKLVVVKDANGKDLARLIIGKEDKLPGGSEGKNLRFVRKAGQDPVYKVDLATDLFSTKFSDWIDTDLLGMKQQHWDITGMTFRDYSFEQRGNDVGVVRKGDVDLAYNTEKSTWTVSKLVNYKDDKPMDAKLGANEELDTTKLNDSKMNVAALKIADVSRKPDDLATALKTGKPFLEDEKSVASLEKRGFVALPDKKPTELFSDGEDMTVSTKDGMEYTLRFGGVKLGLLNKDEQKKADDKSTDEAKRTATQRFVMVSARFNQDLIAKPVLQPVPEAKTPDKAKPGDQKPATEDKAAPKSDQKAPDDGKNPAPKSPDAKARTAPDAKAPAAPDAKSPPAGDNKAPAAKEPAKKSVSNVREDLTLALAEIDEPVPAKQADPPKAPADAAKSAKAEAPGQRNAAAADKKADEQTGGPAKAEAAKTGADTTEPGKSGPATVDANKKEPKAPSDIQRADEEKARDAERKRIEDENKRKQDDYDKAVKTGKEKAKRLNDRFADWYYLISEDEYKKVHLTRSEIIKKKAGADAASSLGPAPDNPFEKQKKDDNGK